MNNEELKHYGVLGMKWGIRHYQKKESSGKTLTERQKKRYLKLKANLVARKETDAKYYEGIANRKSGTKAVKAARKAIKLRNETKKYRKGLSNETLTKARLKQAKKQYVSSRVKRVINRIGAVTHVGAAGIAGAMVVGAAGTVAAPVVIPVAGTAAVNAVLGGAHIKSSKKKSRRIANAGRIIIENEKK